MVACNNYNKSVRLREKLNPKQQQLVSENLGLIGVHIKRFVRDFRIPHCDREWDDLFQEGCLGLIDTAKRFGQVRDMTFQTFALPRIRNAVSRALYHKFNMIYIPLKQRSNHHRADDLHIPIPEMTLMTNEERLAELPASPSSTMYRQTIGDRIRERYDYAVHKATEWMMCQPSKRDDRRRLIETLKQQRILVPNEDCKTTLRQIARETQSSYSRVSQCEKQFMKIVREVLDADIEFLAMNRYARKTPLGLDNPVDEAFDCNLCKASSDEMLRRYRKADPAGKANLIWRVMESDGEQTERMLRDRFTQLDPNIRRAIIDDQTLSITKSPKKQKNCSSTAHRKKNNFTPTTGHRRH